MLANLFEGLVHLLDDVLPALCHVDVKAVLALVFLRFAASREGCGTSWSGKGRERRCLKCWEGWRRFELAVVDWREFFG